MTSNRKGFSLIEVMVAMTLLAIVMMSLAKMSVSVATIGRTNDLIAKRNAVLQMEANKIGAIPFDSLSKFSTTTKSFTQGTFTYSRRLTITTASTSRDSIKIVVIPASNTAKKDSLTIIKTKPLTNAICTSGCTP
jgi:prepilin-type N-terminal cleavage/methylation domain-containing protein